MTKKEVRRGPASHYENKGQVVRNINREFQETLTFGQRVADRVAQVVGSWPFIITQSAIIVAWIGVNGFLVFKGATQPGYFESWDPYPFILLNLVLSFQAAYTGPVVMMSQNRQAEKDRMMVEHDYQINLKAEQEIMVMMDHLAYQDEVLNDIRERLDALANSQSWTEK